MRASMGARSPVGWPASLRTSWTAPPLLRLAPRMRRSPPRFSRPRPAMLVEEGPAHEPALPPRRAREDPEYAAWLKRRMDMEGSQGS